MLSEPVCVAAATVKRRGGKGPITGVLIQLEPVCL